MERKEAIEIVKNEHFQNGLLLEALKTLIPELQNEDERIRKTLIRLFTEDGAKNYGVLTKEQVITWIEKQGNDNSISGRNITISLIKYLDDNRYEGTMDMSSVECEDLEKAILDSDWGKVYRYMQKKLERNGDAVPDTIKEERDFSKFHEGDWIVTNDKKELFFIKSISCGYLSLEDAEGVTHYPCLPLDGKFHHWTINDAKDGDVLACESGWTCIFKSLVNDETFSSYCFIDRTKWFCGTGSDCHTLKDEFIKAYNGKISPATKEKRELLFSKMKEAGYEWDSEKKELNKL